MRDPKNELSVLRKRVSDIALRDGLEVEALKASAQPPMPESFGGLESSMISVSEEAQLEAVIRWTRPVFRIMNDEVSQKFSVGADGEVDPALLDAVNENPALRDAIPAIGRIEVLNNGDFEWAGTGWIIDFEGEADIIVTNAHVADVFARQSGGEWIFKAGFPDSTKPQAAIIDFREEWGRSAPREFAITDVIWIAPGRRPDVAFLRAVETSNGDRLAPPISLATETNEHALVATIGYPANDSRRYDSERFEKLFGSDFGIKRLAPGKFTGNGQWGMEHDCSTLPGNSGSVLFDLNSGKAAGLHYSGAMFRSNYAVPANEIRRIIKDRPWQRATEAQPPIRTVQRSQIPSLPSSNGIDITYSPDGGVTIGVPDGVTVRLECRAPTASTQVDGPETVEAAAGSVRECVAPMIDTGQILGVDADYLFEDGVLTDEMGVIVRVRPGESLDPAAYGLRLTEGRFPIVVEIGDPSEIAEALFGLEIERMDARRAAYSRNLEDPDFALTPITKSMKATFSVSPDYGWPLLQAFLDETEFEQLTIGMYHVTAPHIVDTLETIAARKRPRSRITLTLDRARGNLENDPDDTSGRTKENDIPERDTLASLAETMADKFLWAKASTGSGGLFSTNYHIKAAVWSDRLRGRRIEDKRVWVSSGNWQTTNQPRINTPIEDLTWSDVKSYNREWHAVIEDAEIAGMFRRHLTQDYHDNLEASRSESVVSADEPMVMVQDEPEEERRPTDFRVFAPLTVEEEMTVLPLLTPDNYPKIVLELIENAKDRILIENQSFDIWKHVDRMPEHFRAILDALIEKQKSGLDVRIIFRSGFGSERRRLRRMKAYGFDVSPDTVRYFNHCHTKGFVIDDDVTVLGSQNLTARGTGPNRDASLLVRNTAVNAYFAELFEYDWSNLSRGRSAPLESAFQVRSFSGDAKAAPSGYRTMTLSEYLGES